MTDARTWRLPWRSLDLVRLRIAAEDVAKAYAGVSVIVEAEEPDIHTCFFTVPGDPEAEDEELQGESIAEISVYDLEGGVVLSLEYDASDNAFLDEEADQLAEDLAEALDADPLDL